MKRRKNLLSEKKNINLSHHFIAADSLFVLDYIHSISLIHPPPSPPQPTTGCAPLCPEYIYHAYNTYSFILCYISRRCSLEGHRQAQKNSVNECKEAMSKNK